MDSRVYLDDFRKQKIACPCRNSKTGPSSP